MLLRNLYNHKFISNKKHFLVEIPSQFAQEVFFTVAVSSVPFSSILLTPLVSLVKVCENQFFGFEFPCKSSNHFF